MGSSDDASTLATTSASASDVARPTGDTLPAADPRGYALGREVARGGMGRIVAADDLRIGRPVAIKELLGASAANAARFEREARVTARLQHPGIVPIYEIGRWPDGTPFYAMRMVEGRTLREALAACAGLDARLALLPAVIAASEAIAFAHSRGVIHRDISPNNVLVGAYGETVVIDWGLAKDVGDDTPDPIGPASGGDDLTQMGAVIGTAAYMPPEQARGESVDKRADVYALGALLYHLLAGEPAYAGKGALQAVLAGPPAPLAIGPRDLVSIVDKAMARDRGGRYADAGELAAELRRFETGRLVEAHAYSRRELAWRWLVRNRAAVAVGVLSAVALAAAVGYGATRIMHERDAAMAAKDGAVKTTGRLYAEQGRLDLIAGAPWRALPSLVEAYRRGDHAPETELMLALAMREVDHRERVIAGDPDDPIRAVALDDAGAHVLIAAERDLALYDVATGAAAWHVPIAGAAGAVVAGDASRAVAWSRDGHVTVVGPSGATIAVSSEPDIRAVSLAGDGKRVIVGTDMGHWQVFDTTTGAQVAVGRGLARSVPSSLGRRGDRVLVETNDGMVVSEIGGQVLPPLPRDRTLYDADLDASETHIVACGDNVVEIWDLTSSTARARIARDGAVSHCRFDRSGSRVLTVTPAGAIELWSANLSTDTLVPGPPGGHVEAEFVGEHLVAASDGNRLQLYDVETAIPIASYEVTGRYAFSGDGEHLATSDDRNVVRVTRIDHGAAMPTRLYGGSDMAYLDDHHIVSFGGALRIEDLDDRARTMSLDGLQSPMCVGVDAIAARRFTDDSIVMADVHSGALIKQWEAPLGTGRLAMSTDGRRLAAVIPGAYVVVFDATTATPLAQYTLASTEAWLSPDGKRLETDVDNALLLYDLDHPKAPPRRIELGAPLFGDRWMTSPDGKWIGVPIQQPDDASLQLREAATGKLIVTIPHAYQTNFIADRAMVSSSDGWIVTVSLPDGAIHRVATEPGIEVGIPSDDGAFLYGMHADGELSVISATDGRTLVRLPFAPLPPHYDRPEWSYRGLLRSVGHNLVAAGYDFNAVAARWDLHLETRTPAEIDDVIARAHPRWTIDRESGRIVPN